MKIQIEAPKTIEIVLPDYPFYCRIDAVHKMFLWMKNEASCTVVIKNNQIYNDVPKNALKCVAQLNYKYSIIEKSEFDNAATETVDFLTLIPF